MITPTILVVDDERSIQDVIADCLEDEGYRVLTANDGAAIPLAREQQPDLLLLDFMMPRANGAELSMRLRGDPDTADIPIIGMSAVPTQARRAGMRADAWLPKPFDLDDLLDTVASVLDKAG